MGLWVACIIHAAQGQLLYFKRLLSCPVCVCVCVRRRKRETEGMRVYII